MKKETFKRRIRKITAFAAAVAMAVTITMPGEIFDNIDFGITVFAEENGYVNGFCTDYEADGVCETHTGCNGYQPATDSDSDGVYEIGNAGQLYWFAALVNGTDGLTQNVGANAILTNNITINENVLVGDTLNSANASGFRQWTPIGSNGSYTGTFNGDNHTISGLYYSYEGSDRVRFGFIATNTGSIINTTIDNSYISIKTDSTNTFVGFLVGFNVGIIKNCKNYGLESVEGPILYIGGLCGNNGAGNISDCTNYGKITATVINLPPSSGEGHIGGVIGNNMGEIVDCNNKSIVNVTDNSDYGTLVYVGGICGTNSNNITRCNNSGTVEGNKNVGGVCGGHIKIGQYPSYCGTITNCYNTGTVKGTSEVGGICGYNYWAGTIENCYSAGSVSGSSSSVGGVCGNNYTSSEITDGSKSTIRNCYFDNDKHSGDAVGSSGSSGIVEKVEGKTSEDFSEGEVCYLLNNGTTDGTQVWYQTLDSEAYPNLDNTNKESRTVYACTPCTGVFSNTSGQTAQHTFAVDTENGKQHKCEKCGKTHNAEFTADDTADTISICHGFGTVTLKTPTENLTYDGTAKAATVTGELTGFDTPEILYKLKGSSEEAVETAPVNAGTYVASITYTDADSDKHFVSVEYTIGKADPVVTADTEQNVVCGVGTFTEPVAKGVDGNTLAGTFTYDSKSYADTAESLKTKANGTTGSIDYTFTPTDTTNYNTASGTINYTMEVDKSLIKVEPDDDYVSFENGYFIEHELFDFSNEFTTPVTEITIMLKCFFPTYKNDKEEFENSEIYRSGRW